MKDSKHSKNINYFDDKKVTQELLKEIEERKEGKRKNPSDFIIKEFFRTFERIMTKHSYKNYSEGWKQDFFSRANFLFVKHWWKFNPKKQQKNYYQREGKKIYKDEKDLLGAHNWFTLLIITAIHDIIRFKKKRKKAEDKMIFLSDKSLKEEVNHHHIF